MILPWAPILGLAIGLIVVLLVDRYIVRHQVEHHPTILRLDSAAVLLVFASYVISEGFKISKALDGTPFEFGLHDVGILLAALGGSVVIYIVAKRS
jgi:hypothetical protein